MMKAGLAKSLEEKQIWYDSQQRSKNEKTPQSDDVIDSANTRRKAPLESEGRESVTYLALFRSIILSIDSLK
jgi:hypothetical protein